jgi:hypothetical protein
MPLLLFAFVFAAFGTYYFFTAIPHFFLAGIGIFVLFPCLVISDLWNLFTKK